MKSVEAAVSTDGHATSATSRGDEVRLRRIAEVLPSLARIVDPALATAVAEIWLEAWNESAWQDLLDVPKGIYPNVDSRSLVEHVNGVTDGAYAFAQSMEEVHGWTFDADLLITSGLLHDVSKVVEYAPGEDGRAVVSEYGRQIQHGFWTTQRVLERGLGLDLAHIIVAHTPVSRMTPHSVESLVLYYADMLDSDLLSWHAGLPLLLKK